MYCLLRPMTEWKWLFILPYRIKCGQRGVVRVNISSFFYDEEKHEGALYF